MGMRRSFLLAAVAVATPLAAILVAHGCSSEPPFESACVWVADPENCYREFREDMLANQAKAPFNGDCSPPPADGGAATEANSDPAKPAGTPNGQFLQRAMLDVCILAAGGQVVFEPPIDLSKIPPDLSADPITYKIKLILPNGTECGAASYTSPHGFSITIDAPPDAGAPSDGGTIDAAAVDLGDDDGGTPSPYGTFTQVIQPGRDAFDSTCPSGESHHFTLDEVIGSPAAVGGATTSACPGFAPLVPAAALQIYPGGINNAGGVSFAIVYPPTIGSPAGAKDAYPVLDDRAQKVKPLTPDRIVYFNCSVPAAPEQCLDGVKNGGETDIDCGGPTVASQNPAASTCPARCVMGQQCLQNSDCDMTTTLPCKVDPKTGMRKCGGGT